MFLPGRPYSAVRSRYEMEPETQLLMNQHEAKLPVARLLSSRLAINLEIRTGRTQLEYKAITGRRAEFPWQKSNLSVGRQRKKAESSP